MPSPRMLLGPILLQRSQCFAPCGRDVHAKDCASDPMEQRPFHPRQRLLRNVGRANGPSVAEKRFTLAARIIRLVGSNATTPFRRLRARFSRRAGAYSLVIRSIEVGAQRDTNKLV
jgi:hypothetical protein